MAIDLECDSKVDEYLPFDEEPDPLGVRRAGGGTRLSDNGGIGANTWITIGLIVMLLALLVALGYFLSQVALLGRLPSTVSSSRCRPTLIPKLDEPVDVDKVADLLQPRSMAC